MTVCGNGVASLNNNPVCLAMADFMARPTSGSTIAQASYGCPINTSNLRASKDPSHPKLESRPFCGAPCDCKMKYVTAPTAFAMENKTTMSVSMT